MTILNTILTIGNPKSSASGSISSGNSSGSFGNNSTSSCVGLYGNLMNGTCNNRIVTTTSSPSPAPCMIKPSFQTNIGVDTMPMSLGNGFYYFYY